jgi:hypothetical protein
VHNLHLIVVNADSHEDACDRASEILESFGDSNNWSVVCGSVSKDKGTVHSTGEGRFDPKEMLEEESNAVKFINNKKKTTLSSLENLYQSFKNKTSMPDDLEKFPKILKDLIDGKKVDSFNIYLLKDFIETKYQLANTSDEDDVWTGNFYSFKYDQCGLTNHTEHGEDQYCVFIDMHS